MHNGYRQRTGHPVRALRTNFPREYSKLEYGGASDEELDKFGMGTLRAAVVDGDLEKGSFLSGQIAAMVKKEQPASEIIREVIEGAEPVLRSALKWVK